MLRLHSGTELVMLERGTHLHGKTIDHLSVSCIDCITLSTSRGGAINSDDQNSAEVFPHFVVVGDYHINPEASEIKRIGFTLDSLHSLFYDFDAFGHVINASSVIDKVLEGMQEIRKVEAGEYPEIFYFTGKYTMAAVQTTLGLTPCANIACDTYPR